MILEEGLHAHLKGFAGLAALVGERIYPVILPQGVQLPVVRYQRVDSPRVHSRDGYSGLTYPRISVTAFGTSALEAKTVAAQIVAAAVEVQQTGQMGGLPVQGIEIADEVDLYDSQAKVHYTVVDLVIWHQE